MEQRIRPIVAAALILIATHAVRTSHAAAAESLSDLTGPWRLFVDDGLVQARNGVVRTYHAFEKYAGNPVMVADRVWEGANIYLYGTVLPAESGPGYRMWYHSLNFSLPKGDQVHANYATSTDGIHWDKPNLGIITFNGSTDNNMFIVPGNCPSVMHTPWDAGVGRSYKIMRGVGGQFGGAWSPDGLHWTEDPYAICPPASDVCTFNWDPHTQQYMGFPKMGAVVNGLSRRSTGVWATGNFESWPSPRLVLTPDSWDDRWGPDPALFQGTHFYGLCGFAYESTYLGFLWILRATGKVSGADDGPIFVELVSSHDGIHWLREEGDRPPILPLGPNGAWDDGMVFTTTHPLVEGNTIRLYYGGFNSTHADQGVWHAAIGTATLRKDGFASLDAAATAGTVTTKQILGASGLLHVNYVAAAGGSLKVEVLDAGGTVVPGYGGADCTLPQGDYVDQVVTWGAQTELPAASGPIRLRFVLQNASLYSFMPGDAVQILDESPSPPLAVLYDFEGDVGQTARDKLLDDGAQDSAFQGDVWVSTNPALAAFGDHAAAFGYDVAMRNTLTIPETTNLGTHFTLAAQIYSAAGGYARIFSTPPATWGEPVASLALDLDPSGLLIPGLRLTCKGMAISSQFLTAGAAQYHHVAVTYDDGEVTLYWDGVSVGHGYVSGGDPVQLPGNLLVGPGSAADVQFIGYADDVLVTSRALAGEEIASLAQNGAAAFFGVARAASDFDGDTDVDLADFAVLQGCFNGPNAPPACGGAAGAPQFALAMAAAQEPPEATPSAAAVSISFVERWDSYALGTSDPAYLARWASVPGTSRYQVDMVCPSSTPNTIRIPKAGPCGITHDLVPDLQAVLVDAVEVAGTDATPLVLACNACLRDSLQYADVIIELSQGEVHAPGADSATVLPVLAFGMASVIHAPSTQAWFFDGQRWRSASVINAAVETNALAMQINGSTVLLSGGAGSVAHPRAYTGRFDRITIRTQLNDVRARFLDDLRLTGGEVIRACVAPPVVTSIMPTTGRDDERISMRVEGSGFLAGFTQVRLARDGQADILASDVAVAADEQSLTGLLDLNLYAATSGVWDVVVSTPSCPDAVVVDAFTVTQSVEYVAADVDHDGDVDLVDFGVFQACFNGPNRPPACEP